MGPRLIIATAVCAYLVASCGWFLVASAQWHVGTAIISSAPLAVMLGLMLRQRPVVFFYAALLLMPYLAIAITQLLIAPVGRAGAIVCLAAGLAYLALLSLALRALNRSTPTLP